MTPERWREVKRVFEEAAERDLAEREAYLQAACAGEPDLRAAEDPQNEELSIDLADERQLLIELLLESGLRDEAR